MAMSTQMNRSPVESLGLKRPQKGVSAGLPGIDGPSNQERPGFADMLREVSRGINRGIRAPEPQGFKPQDDVRPAARQEQESRSTDRGRPEPTEESGRPVGDKVSAQRSAARGWNK